MLRQRAQLLTAPYACRGSLRSLGACREGLIDAGASARGQITLLQLATRSTSGLIRFSQRLMREDFVHIVCMVQNPRLLAEEQMVPEDTRGTHNGATQYLRPQHWPCWFFLLSTGCRRPGYGRWSRGMRRPFFHLVGMEARRPLPSVGQLLPNSLLFWRSTWLVTWS